MNMASRTDFEFGCLHSIEIDLPAVVIVDQVSEFRAPLKSIAKYKRKVHWIWKIQRRVCCWCLMGMCT